MLHQETMKCISIAESFEERTLHESANKEMYIDKMAKKLAEITQKREQAARTMQVNQMGIPMNNNNMGMPPNGMGNMNNIQNAGMGGMNMNMNNMGIGMGMGMNMNMNMGNNAMGMGMPNGGQQNFPAQLQRQMQPSPIPPQQNQQPQNNTLDPAALQNAQMTQQMAQQQQMSNMAQNMSQQTPRQHPPLNMGMNMNGQAGMPAGAPSGPEIMAVAQKMYDGMQEPKKTQLRASLLSSMNEQQRANASKDGDPLFKFMISKAKENLMKQRQMRLSQGVAQNGVGMQMGNNMVGNANNAQQTPVSQSGAQNFDFSSIMGQQANAIKLQESGEQVVPASNNANLALGGQVNMSQGVNPQQLLANQHNQGGPNPQQQMQFMAMQQRMQQERQRQMNIQNQMAQQQGMAQQRAAQNQLRGQPGGLNAPNALNGGQVNSPSMNMGMTMLTQPMAPPGQTTPSTPQPNRPQNMPQTPANPASQLAQHYQSMVSQNNAQLGQGGQGPTPQQQQVMISRLPQEVKDRLSKLPPEQLSSVLQSMRENPQRYGPMLTGLGMPPQNNQMGNQQLPMSGMPPNMSNAIPAFNSQPPPNQEQMHQGSNDQAGFAQKAQTTQQMMMRQRAMDLREFPKPVLQNLGIQVPTEVRSWGDLKQHIQRNQAVLPPDLLQKLGTHQLQWYKAHPEEMAQAVQAFQQLMRNASQQKSQAQQLQQQQQQQQQQLQQQQQQAPQSARPPSAVAAPTGQAPPAQMVPPNALMQQQQQPHQNGGPMSLQQLQIKTPTPEDLLLFRQKVPTSQNMSDEQIKAAMMRRLQQQRVAQHQQMMQQAQMQRAQTLSNGGQPVGVPQANQQQPQRAVPQQQAHNQQMNMQGQKRQQSSSDDVMEIPNPNQQQMNIPQPPTTQQNPPNLPQMPSREQLAKMPQQQRLVFMQKMQQMDALRKAQNVTGQQQQPQGQQPSTLPQQQSAMPSQQQQQQAGGLGAAGEEFRQLENRVKQLWQEVQRANPKGPPMQLDSQGIEQGQLSLKRLWPAVMNLDRTFYPALRAPNIGEVRVREAMKAKIVVQQNASDDKGTIKDYLSVSPMDLKKLEVFIGQYFTALKEIKARQDAARAQAQAVSGVTQAQQPPTQKATQPAKASQPQAPPAPERKQSQSNARKAAAAANKAPPAPTENKTFDWGAQSPHGVPKYEPTRSELTADKLKLPPQKRRRTAQQADGEPTPPAQTTTPQATGSSPDIAGVKSQAAEQTKKLQAQAKVEAPKFKCDDSLCEASIIGFDTEAMLRQHQETVHKPVEDPFKLLDEALSATEKSFKAEKSSIAPKIVPQPRGKPVLNAKGFVKKEALTPDIKTENGTLRPGSVGKTAAKSTPTAVGKKGIDTKGSDAAVDVPGKERTLLESMASKIAFDLPPAEAARPDAPTDFTQDLFEELLMDVQTAGGHTFLNDWADMDDLSNVTDWGLRPEPESSPDLTPSSGASQSSRESDVSQSDRLRLNLEWDAFGNGDTGVPEVLMQTLGLSEDTTMADAGADKKDGEESKKKADDQWDWSSDLMDWDSMFGAQAGLLEADGMEFGTGDFVF